MVATEAERARPAEHGMYRPDMKSCVDGDAEDDLLDFGLVLRVDVPCV